MLLKFIRRGIRISPNFGEGIAIRSIKDISHYPTLIDYSPTAIGRLSGIWWILYLGIPASSPELMMAVGAVGAPGFKQTQEQRSRKTDRGPDTSLWNEN
jgi:hypothetical protein